MQVFGQAPALAFLGFKNSGHEVALPRIMQGTQLHLALDHFTLVNNNEKE
jgi:hypothetical protein